MKIQPSNIEIAKALKSVRAILPKPKFEKVFDICVNLDDRQEVLRMIGGLSQEDEFVMLCKLMETCTSIVALEQRPILRNGYIIPDFLVYFKPGCSEVGVGSENFKELKCLVEVKSTQKSSYTIKGRDLKSRRDFANSLGLKLFVAVRFQKFGRFNYWNIVEDTGGNSLTVDENFAKGCAFILLDDFALSLAPDITIIYDYVQGWKPEHSGHSLYGSLMEIVVYTKDNYYIINQDKSTRLGLVGAVLQFYVNESNLVRKEVIGAHTILRYCISKSSTPLLSNLLFWVNTENRDFTGNYEYDPGKFISHSDRNGFDELASREHLLAGLWPMFERGFFRRGHIESNNKSHFELWKHYGGKL